MRIGMKKQWKMAKSIVCILALVLVSTLGIHMPVHATEAGQTTKVYYRNDQGWDTVNVWAWKMSDTSQLVKNGWPGDAATAYDGTCEGDWVVYEFEAGESFGVLFDNGESGDGNQTGDVTDLEPGQTYWVVAEDSSTANDNGYGGGFDLTASTEALAGYPEGPAADTESTPSTDTQSDTTASEDATNTVVWVVIVVAVVAVAAGATAYIVAKKKKK